jgi:hypothetical protein
MDNKILTAVGEQDPSRTGGDVGKQKTVLDLVEAGVTRVIMPKDQQPHTQIARQRMLEREKWEGRDLLDASNTEIAERHNESIERIIDELSNSSSRSPIDTEEGLRPPHECKIIARAPDMAEGRDWWIGKLLKPVFVRGIEEKWCLHLKTPLKNVVFLLNESDLSQISVLMACAHGQPIFEGWIKNMMPRAIKAGLSNPPAQTATDSRENPNPAPTPHTDESHTQTGDSWRWIHTGGEIRWEKNGQRGDLIANVTSYQASKLCAAFNIYVRSAASTESTDTERLDWLEHVLGKCPGSVCDRIFGDNMIAHGFFMANLTLREAIDKARGLLSNQKED